MGRLRGRKFACRTSGDSGSETSDRINVWRKPSCGQNKKHESDNPLCSTTGSLLLWAGLSAGLVAEICRNPPKSAVDCRKVSWVVVMC